MRFVLGAAVLACCACSVDALTEVVVIIEAEPTVRARSTSLAVKVATVPTSDDEARVTVLDHSNTPWQDGRYTVAIAPGRQATERYVVEASALEGGARLATARLISGFVPGETRYVRLLLEDECVGMLSCEASSTCRGGACVDARVEPGGFGARDEGAPTTVDLAPSRAAPPEDAGVTTPDAALVTDASDHDASVHDASVHDASARDASVTAEDAGLPSMEPAHDASSPMPVGALCRAGYYEGALMGSYRYITFGLAIDTTIQPAAPSPALSLSLAEEASGRLRIAASCVNGTMVTPTSRWPFLARMEGTLDCATGILRGTLEGLYITVANSDAVYSFEGPIEARFEADALQAGVWSAVEGDPNDYNEGTGQGTWSAQWRSMAPPSASTDPCAELDAFP